MTREERQKAIDALKISAPVIAVTQEEFNDYIQTLNQVMDWLEQEPCEDCVSRIEALNSLDKVENKDSWYRLTDVMKMIRNLPPVTPQPKTGHWTINEDEENAVHGHCSVCGWEAHYYEDDIIGMPYCPNCGAKMIEPQEREDV